MESPAKEWRDGKPRWDDQARVPDLTATLTAARERVRQARTGMSGFENSYGRPPRSIAARAQTRANYAPAYYDLHRAERLTTASGDRVNDAIKYHRGTRTLAERIANERPPSLEAALEQYADDPNVTRQDIAREYMLWAHSINPIPLEESGVEMPPGLFYGRPSQMGDLVNFDETVRAVYGQHTRGPQVANLSFAAVPRNALVRGTTTPNGHMIVGVRPGTSDPVRIDNRAAGIEQMAHSLLARHHKPEADAFEAHFGGERPRERLGIAMAHGAFSKPSMDPQSDAAPSDREVNFAARAFERNPAHDPGLFRSH